MPIPETISTLSPRQAELVAAVDRLTDERGFPPTLRELAKALGVHHTRARALADGAERRGAITHEPRVPRSWCVVRPDDAKAD